MLKKFENILKDKSFYIMRCVLIHDTYAYGIVEGLPGAVVATPIQPSTEYRNIPEGEIFRTDVVWKQVPVTEPVEPGHRYLVQKQYITKDMLCAEVIGMLENADVTVINRAENALELSVDEIREELDLTKAESICLKVYHKAFGVTYSLGAYDLSVKTIRSTWRYELLTERLNHQNTRARCTKKTNHLRAKYLKGWHLQETSSPLTTIGELLNYVIAHDYGYYATA